MIYAFTVFLLIKFGEKYSKKCWKKAFESKKESNFFTICIFGFNRFNRIKRCNLCTNSNAKKIYQMYNFCLLALAEINGLLFIMYINKDYVNNIIVSILTFGVVFTYTMPFAHQIDEKTHFLTCLNFAVGNFGLYGGSTKRYNI